MFYVSTERIWLSSAIAAKPSPKGEACLRRRLWEPLLWLTAPLPSRSQLKYLRISGPLWVEERFAYNIAYSNTQNYDALRKSAYMRVGYEYIFLGILGLNVHITSCCVTFYSPSKNLNQVELCSYSKMPKKYIRIEPI